MTFQSTLPTRGSDMPLQDKAKNDIVFQSTLPTRGSDLHNFHHTHPQGIYFNPRSPRGGATSIFAPYKKAPLRFQSTLPARGSDGCALQRAGKCGGFQSTLPARGSDHYVCVYHDKIQHFNPRSPQGGATIDDFSDPCPFCISIHAPRKGERLSLADACPNLGNISIHAPRKGERHKSRAIYIPKNYFNPRSPQGGATF